MEESGDSLCGQRCWRAFLQDEPKRFTEDPAREVRFVRKAYRIVLTSQQSPFPDQAKQ